VSSSNSSAPRENGDTCSIGKALRKNPVNKYGDAKLKEEDKTILQMGNA
jgi:hypothetical protein